MKIAAIDIGTNSVRYLLVSKEGSSILELEEQCLTTRLGENLEKTKSINEDAYLRTKKVLGQFIDSARNNGAEQINVIATNVLRNAQNGPDVLRRLKADIGIDIRVLSGKEEAFLAFSGATYQRKNKEDITVIDVGGGSTEFIFSDKLSSVKAYSLEIGAVRLTEAYVVGDPITAESYDTLKDVIRSYLQKVDYSFIQNNILVGVGGTVTTLAAISLGLNTYAPERIHDYILTKKEIIRLANLLKEASVEEKKQLVAIDPKRSDILFAGTMIVNEIMDKVQVNEIVVSTYGILWGLVA